MYNLQYVLSLYGLLISTETNPYFQYFDPYFANHTYTLSSFDDSGEMRFLFMGEYTYTLPTKISFLENTMYRTLRLADSSYNYRIYRFLHNIL